MRDVTESDVPETLVLSWDFPPIDSSVARRSMALANAIVQDGGAVTVLTVDSAVARHDHGVDPALESVVDPRVRVVRIEDHHPDRRQDIATWPRERAQDPAGWRERWAADAASMFDEPDFGHLHDLLVEQAGAIRAQRPVATVVAVAAPLVMAAVAGRVAESAGCELVLDFARIDEHRLVAGAQLVSSAVARARVVWCPDETTRERLESSFGGLEGRIDVVPDGGEVEVRPSPRPPREPGDPVRVACYVEPDAWDSLPELMEAWFEARVFPEFSHAPLRVRGCLPLAGGTVPRMAARQAVDRGVVFEGARSSSERAVGDEEIDVLLVLCRGELPAGRASDHLYAGRPVVWWTAAMPAPDHPYEQADQVTRLETLTGDALAAALVAAANRSEHDLVAAVRPASPWPGALGRAGLDRIPGERA